MKTIRASVAIKSADIILEQNGSCCRPIVIRCHDCPLGSDEIDCIPDDNSDFKKYRVKLLNELRGK